MVSDKLLTCAICDSEVYMGTEDYNDEVVNVIECNCCGLKFYGSNDLITKRELIKEWNTRKPIERIVKQLEQKDDDCGCGKISVWEAIDIVRN
jgi:hypothetical protein